MDENYKTTRLFTYNSGQRCKKKSIWKTVWISNVYRLNASEQTNYVLYSSRWFSGHIDYTLSALLVRTLRMCAPNIRTIKQQRPSADDSIGCRNVSFRWLSPSGMLPDTPEMHAIDFSLYMYVYAIRVQLDTLEISSVIDVCNHRSFSENFRCVGIPFMKHITLQIFRV